MLGHAEIADWMLELTEVRRAEDSNSRKLQQSRRHRVREGGGGTEGRRVAAMRQRCIPS